MEEEAVVDEDARKLYDKILGDFKKDSLIDSVQAELATYSSQNYDFDDNDFVEVYNEDLSNLLDKDTEREFNVSTYIKDEYLEEEGDEKYIVSYQNYDIVDIPPKNHFFFNILMNDELRSKLEKQVDIYELYYLKEIKKHYYYQNSTTYKGSVFSKKDEINVGVFQKLPDGGYIQAYLSYKNPRFPEQPNVTRINVLRGGTVYRKVKGEENRWNVTTLKISDRYTQSAKIMKMSMKNETKGYFTNTYKLLKEFIDGMNLSEHDKLIETVLKQFRQK